MEARSKFGIIVVNIIKSGFEYSRASDRLGAVRLSVLPALQTIMSDVGLQQTLFF